MTLRVVGSAASDAATVSLLDISEAIEGMLAECAGGGAGSAIGIQCDAATVNPAQFSATTPIRRIFTTAITTPPALVYDALIGRTIIRHVSAAGIIGRTCAFNVDGGVRIPAQQLFAAATSIPGAFLRPPRSYTLRHPVRVTALAGGACFVGVSDGGAGVGGNLPFSSCAGWTADPALNAGRWTAQHRRVTGGAITTDLDSGIAAGATWHELGLRYTEGPVPTLEWLMDDVPVFTLTGDAAMLTLTSFINGFYPDNRTLAGAGTTMETGPARFTVDLV